VETNVGGTLYVLEAAYAAGIRRVVYTSTTSVYGAALTPREQRAVWVTEDLTPEPRDIYDVTKLAAEALCREFAREGRLSVVCLRVCRFFPETPWVMAAHRLYRGADVRDIAAAHLLSLTADLTSDFELYNVAGPYAFLPEDCAALWASAPAVIEQRYPGLSAAFTSRGWMLPERIDRVYVSERARARLGYRPQYGIGELLVDQELPTPRPSRLYMECGG
jgi:UDP-glucose 4-epimerase